MATTASKRLPWSVWYQEFELYALTVGWSSWDECRKQALLLHCIGQEGRRIFRAEEAATLSREGASVKREGELFAQTLELLRKIFDSPRDAMSERMLFRKCRQGPGEDVRTYLTNLRDRSRYCAFGELEDQMIRDQFVEGCSSARLRDRLCQEEQLTLQRLELLALADDRAQERQKLVGSGGRRGGPDLQQRAAASSTPVEVAFTSRARGRSAAQGGKQRAPGPAQPQIQGKKCLSCGRTGHLSRDTSCTARGRKCHRCGMSGHFAVMCPDRAKPVRSVEPAVEVLSVASADCPLWKRVKFGGTWLRMLVDTGAAVSIIPRDLYVTDLQHVPLQKTGVALQAYGGARLDVAGVLTSEAETEEGHSCKGMLYVVDGATPLLGRDLQKGLCISVVHGSTVCTVARPSDHDSCLLPDRQVDTIDGDTQVLPAITGFVHRVKVKPDVEPVQQRLRPLPYALREEVKVHLAALEKQGIIEKVTGSSPWISPIVVTRKRNGKIRMCIDLKRVNEAVIANGHPLPHMQEMLDNLSGAKFFSCLDMSQAFHQLELHDDSKDLTAFVTHEGVWRFKRCPYGLKSLPQCFQRMMEIILRGMSGTQVYMDDVIVSGRSREEHDQRLEAVQQRLRGYHVTLNREKCRVGLTSVEFLGFTIGENGISVSQERVSALRDMKSPTTPKELHTALGMFGFYSQFVAGYSTRVEELRRALRKDAPPFQWTPGMDAAFCDVRDAILKSQALSMFDPELPTVVTTDASNVGLGAVLSQVDPDLGERVVAFASSTLNPAQRRYSVSEKEALAIVWSVRRWHRYLWGRQFTLRTDHQALITLMSASGIGRAGMRISRWAARLMEYDYTVEYVKGVVNPADALSRLPVEEEVEEEEPLTVAVIAEHLPAVTREELLTASAGDEELQQLREQLQKPWPRRMQLCQPAVRPFFRCREELTVVGNVILRGSAKVVVPAKLRSRLLQLAHEAHQGIVKTKQRVRDLYWWPGIHREVEELVKTCEVCSAADKSARPRCAPMQPVPFPAEPWSKLGLDFIGPMAGGRPGQRFAIVAVDYFSKWIEVGFCEHPSSEVVIQFIEKLASREGYPEEVVSDCGSAFTSDRFTAYMRSVGVRHITVTPYHPQASGQVERANRSVKEALQSADLKKLDRSEYLQLFLLSYRSTVQATTGYSPAELLHGRRMRTKLHVAAEKPDLTPDQAEQRRKLTIRVEGKQQTQKAYYDQNKHVRNPEFKVGDLVRRRLPQRQRKGRQKFSKPLYVKSVTGPASYRLSDGSRVHAETLVPCWVGRRSGRASSSGSPVFQAPGGAAAAADGAGETAAGDVESTLARSGRRGGAPSGSAEATSPGRPVARASDGDAAAETSPDRPATCAPGGGAAGTSPGRRVRVSDGGAVMEASPGERVGARSDTVSDVPRDALHEASETVGADGSVRAAVRETSVSVSSDAVTGLSDRVVVTRSGRVVRPPNRL